MTKTLIMNKNLLLALFFACISSALSAQIPILTAASINPIIGDAFISIVCDTNGVSQQSGGANIIWDFTGLSLSTDLPPVDTGTVVAPGSTTSGILYPSATY